MNIISHFTNLKALKIILKTNKIRFTSLSKLNDPFEYNYVPITPLPLNNACGLEVERKARELFDLKYKVFCGSVCRKSSKFKSWDNPPMWAHYANGNNGVIINFKINNIHNNINANASLRLIRSDSMVYVRNGRAKTILLELDNLKENALENSIYDYLDEYVKIRYFNKHLKWKYENEYRILLRSNNDDYDYVSLENCIDSIILGEKVNAKGWVTTFKKIEESGIVVFRVANRGLGINYKIYKLFR